MHNITLTITEAAVPTFITATEKALDCLRSSDLTRIRVGASFFASLDTILRLARNSPEPARIYADHEPLSFGFTVGHLSGGFIYHGPENPNSLSVQLTPTTGWQLHT